MTLTQVWEPQQLPAFILSLVGWASTHHPSFGTRVWTLAWLKSHQGGTPTYNLIRLIRQFWHGHVLMRLFTHKKSSKHRNHFSAVKQSYTPKVSGSALGKSQGWSLGHVITICSCWDLSPGSQHQQGTEEPRTKVSSRHCLLAGTPNVLLKEVHLQATWQAKPGDKEVGSREKFYSYYSQARRHKHKSQIHLPEDRV